jgi:hypothetical protein
MSEKLKQIYFFRNDPESSEELCNLYCQILFYSGILCIPSNTSSTTTTTTTSEPNAEIVTTIIGATVATVSTVTTSIISANTSSLMSTVSSATTETTAQSCPDSYVTNPAQPLLCALWMELQSIQSIYSSGAVFITPVTESTPCIYRLVQILTGSY